MAKRKKIPAYSYDESLTMLGKLQQMAIDEGNISLSLKAEELKCKIAAALADQNAMNDNEDLTKILVDFINDKQNHKNSADICATADEPEKI